MDQNLQKIMDKRIEKTIGNLKKNANGSIFCSHLHRSGVSCRPAVPGLEKKWRLAAP